VQNAATFGVTAFGAKGDGKAENREAINKAIQAASAAGGGTVEFPAGTWAHARENPADSGAHRRSDSGDH
jgi:polygalacturonase